MVIKRRSLRAQIRDELLQRLRDGSIEAGAGINEAELASELGVSRTPLREALIGLETEGYIESEIGKGFRFAVLGSSELEELAPVIAELECLAIELTPLGQLAELGTRLVALAEDFPESVATHREIIDRDEQWHDVLTSACPNGRLLSLLASIKGAVHRYEFEMVPSDALIERVAAEHLEIARALVARDRKRAQVALRGNWINGTARLIDHSRR